MRRILITPDMKNDASHYSKNLFANKRKNGKNAFETPEIRLNYLMCQENIYSNHKYFHYVYYLNQLRIAINEISPDKYDYYHSLYFNLTDDELRGKVYVKTSDIAKEFYEWIVWAMRYDDAKNDPNLKNHFTKCGLRTCVYCNSQFAIAVGKTNGDKKAHYELDHIWPKSKYPFLCTNFYNLVPCCGTCNRRKSDYYDENKKTKKKSTIYSFRQEDLNLYTTDFGNVEMFRFYINEDKLAQCWVSAKYNPNDIEIDFSAIDKKNKDLEQFYDDKFDIKALCKTHTDAIEELLWKKRIYNQTYITILEEQFGLLFPNMTDFNRFLLGNYDKPEDVHKRPLAKMIQDIARQLDMI